MKIQAQMTLLMLAVQGLGVSTSPVFPAPALCMVSQASREQNMLALHPITTTQKVHVKSTGIAVLQLLVVFT
jgi:hypothetical protein